MNRMHIYTAHVNLSLPAPYENAVFVEEGFSWKAFIFGPLWALYHRLWLVALGMVFYNVALMQLLAAHMFSHVGIAILQFGFQIIVAYHANDWLRARLKKRGFITADIVTGDSLMRAEQRFFDRYFALQSPTAFTS